MVTDERRAHLALRKLQFTDPEKWAKRRARMRSKAPAPLKAVPLPVLDAYDSRRFWAKVQRRPDGACWPWKAARCPKGYGRFKIGGKLYGAHRLAYADTNGPIADAPEFHGSVVMHKCDNPRCCNPAHLELARQVNNVRDMVAKGRRRLVSVPASLVEVR